MEVSETSEISRNVPKTTISAKVVKPYEERVGVEYPALFLKLKSDAIEEHKLRALKTLLGADFSDLHYSVYLETEMGTAQLGEIDSISLKTLLLNELFRSFDISMALSESRVIRGTHLLALCG